MIADCIYYYRSQSVSTNVSSDNDFEESTPAPRSKGKRRSVSSVSDLHCSVLMI